MKRQWNIQRNCWAPWLADKRNLCTADTLQWLKQRYFNIDVNFVGLGHYSKHIQKIRHHLFYWITPFRQTPFVIKNFTPFLPFAICWGLNSYYESADFPAGIYLLKVNNRNNRARCELCLKLTIKTPERIHCIVNFEHIPHLFLVLLLLTLNM